MDLDAGQWAGLFLTTAVVVGFALLAPTARLPATLWTGSDEVALPLIAQHPLTWRLANLGFAIATALTTAGLWILSDAVGDVDGAPVIAGAALYTLASALWLITLLLRLLSVPSVAAGFVATGSIDPAHVPLARLAGALFVGFIYLSAAALVAVGAGLVDGGVISPVFGWISVVVGVGTMGGMIVLGDMLPAIVYLPTGLIGFALLMG